MEFVFGVKELMYIIGVVFSFAGGYFTLKFRTENSKKSEADFKTFKEFVYKELRQIDKKCDEMIKEKIARDSFVSIKLYESERKHLTESVKEIKEQNQKILEMITKFIGAK